MKKEQVQPVLCNQQQAAHASQSSRRAWITPNYAEIDLNSARAGGTTNSDLGVSGV